ncbi:MAG: 16S rRNA (adenine(1518)-N(6)/adenine(1519)-N(6))-dimethyltransferase RsmA [Parcubacteria group bacterium]
MVLAKQQFDPTDVRQLKQTFAALGKPNNYKQFGQNFLIDPALRDSILAAAALVSSDTVLEIGPGSGVLTQKLVECVGRVVAIDIDPYLLEVTRLACQGANNLELRLEDVRKINLPKLFGQKEYVLVSNVPYYLSGYLLELFTETPNSPKRMVLTLQREVAERIVAGPGEQSILSIAIALFGRAKLMQVVSRSAFWPEPKVDSAVLVIERHVQPIVLAAQKKPLMRVVKAGFSAKRKKLANALAGGLHLEVVEVRERLKQAGLDPNIRAQELTLKDWALLSQKFK